MTEQQMIALAEVAKVQGRTEKATRAEVAELGLWVGTDWAGREALTEQDARALVDGSARRQFEGTAAWQEHLRVVAEWEQARVAACRAGAEEAAEKAARSKSSRTAPALAAARREGAQEAGVRFERTTARPEFNGSRDATKLQFVSPAEEGRGAIVGALVGKMRRAPVEAPEGEVA